MKEGKSRPVVKKPVAQTSSVHNGRKLGLKSWGFMKNGALTARTEMRNCLFVPVRWKKKMSRHYCFHFPAKQY